MTNRRRTTIGLCALGLIGAGLAAIHLSGGADVPPPPSMPDEPERRTPETFSLDEARPRPGPRGPRGPESPPLLPPVDLGNGVVVTVRSLAVMPSIGRSDFFSSPRRVSRSGPSPADFARDRSQVRQQVRLTIDLQDPEPTSDQDHRIRVAGIVARGFGMAMPLLSGTRGPRAMANVNVDPELRRIPVEVTVATGPFVEVERMAPGDAAPRRAANAPEQVPWHLWTVEEAKGMLCIVVNDTDVPDETFDGQSWLLRAVCRDGRVVPINGGYSSHGNGVELFVNVPFAEVDHVVYGYRPCAWRPVGELEIPQAEWEITPQDGSPGIQTASMAELGRFVREQSAAATQSSTGFGFKIRRVTTAPAGDRPPPPRDRPPRPTAG